MSLRVHYEILNQKGTPAFFSDTYANRPAFGFAGRVFISTDTGQIFEDTGSAWSLIADAGVGGGTLASVCANGNTTSTGIVITAGNLGINTSSPGAPLDIHGTGTNAQFNGTGTNNAYLVFQNAGTSKWRIGNTYNAGANSFDLYNNGTASTALSFNNTTNAAYFPNNVGIGTNTPAYPLDVNGQTRISDQLSVFASGSNYGLYVQGVSNQYAARIIGNATTGNSYGLNIQAGTNSSDIPLLVTSYSVGTPFLKVTGAGNVGIGTSTPGVPLEISAASTELRLRYNSTTYLDFRTDFINQVSTGANNWQFQFNSSPVLQLNSTGSVLIGTTTDNGYKLQVEGDMSTLGSIYVKQNNVLNLGYNQGGGAILYYNANGNLYITPRSGFGTTFSAGVVTISNLAGTGSRAVLADASGNLSAPVSDISVKENIQSIGYGLNEIIKMKPVWFDFIDEYKNYGTGRQNGNIAQEMETIIPEAVFTTPSTGKKGINYDQLHAVYIKAIQEINEKLERNNIN
jgi:hypothetical protein